MRLTKEQKEMVLELYKCHFSAKEVSERITSCSLTNIFIMFRAFKLANIQKYDRLGLLGGRFEYDEAQNY